MRVRDRDGANATEVPNRVQRALVDQRDAIPEHIAFRVQHEQRALRDPERRPTST
jgi:hypothetical protein